MVEAAFDLTELDRLNLQMMKMANEVCPRETKNFINRQGTQLKKEFTAQYKEKTKKKTGNLLKGVNKSSPYQYEGSYQIRVRNSAHHAHLVEYPHEVYRAGKDTGKKSEGRYVAQSAGEGFTGKYLENADQFVDELLEKGFGL